MKSISITRLKPSRSLQRIQFHWLSLEMKSISITRLKRDTIVSNSSSDRLEMKSISITRLKREFVTAGRVHKINLKWKVSRLRDWNILSACCTDRLIEVLKWKVSRLRDWNGDLGSYNRIVGDPWNEKYLDYEIETYDLIHETPLVNVLEMKSISITRLKQKLRTLQSPPSNFLEMKSISITRLKQSGICSNSQAERCAWNEKYLDYEIETCRCCLDTELVLEYMPWNEKYLDYEIETIHRTFRRTKFAFLEMKSISITRLKLHPRNAG